MTTTEEKTTIQKIFNDNEECIGFVIPNFYLGYYIYLDKKQKDFQKSKETGQETEERYYKCTILIERSILGESVQKEIKNLWQEYAKKESLLIDKASINSIFVEKDYSQTNPEMYKDKYAMTLYKRKNYNEAIEIYDRKGNLNTDYSVLKPGSRVDAFITFYKSKRIIAGKEQYYAVLSLDSIKLIELGKWPTDQYNRPPKLNQISKHPFRKIDNNIDSEIPF